MKIFQNKNLLNLIDTICNDKSLITEFSQKESFDELYDFCLKIVPGYTKEEFKEFIVNLSNAINSKDPIESLKTNNEIDDETLKDVNGGFNFETFLNKISKLNLSFNLGIDVGKTIRELFK